MSNLKQGYLDLTGAVRVAAKSVTGLSRFALSVGDFLVGLSGSLGNFAWVRDVDTPAFLNQRVGRIRPLGVSSAFLAWWYVSPIVQSSVRRLAAGGAQANVSPSQLLGLTIPIPSPEEQSLVADVFNAIHEVQEVHRRRLCVLSDIKHGLLGALLGGDVRVNPRAEVA
jgi:type I restriction enzyme S subunit